MKALDMVNEAKKHIENLSNDQVEKELNNPNVVVVDIREQEELDKTGKIAGSVHAPRGLLEFYADETHPLHKPQLDKNKRIILHCASGGRSALAAQTLKQMGYGNVAHLEPGFKGWAEAGKPVQK